MRVYVASSWRNDYQPGVVETLRSWGHEVYDFRHPSNGDNGFHWSEIDPAWQDWSPESYRAALDSPIADRGFNNDKGAMVWADVCVLVLPCGRSAHAEAGWMAGQGKPTYVVVLEPTEPELMYRLFDGVITTVVELERALGRVAGAVA